MTATQNPAWRIRPAEMDDLETLIRLRRLMFVDMGYDDLETLDRAERSWRAYFAEQMPTGVFRVWIAVIEHQIVGCIGLVIHSVPPAMGAHDGRVGYIMNLVIEPDMRRRGIAESLLTHVLGVLREESVSVATLHASREGRRLYEKLGFALRDIAPEMALRIH